MAYLRHNYRVHDRLEAAEVCISDPSPKQRTHVDVKLIERRNAVGLLLSQAESARSSVRIIRVESGAPRSGDPCSVILLARLGDGVGEEGEGAVVAHALDELEESNGVDYSKYAMAGASTGRELLKWIGVVAGLGCFSWHLPRHGILAGTR